MDPASFSIDLFLVGWIAGHIALFPKASCYQQSGPDPVAFGGRGCYLLEIFMLLNKIENQQGVSEDPAVQFLRKYHTKHLTVQLLQQVRMIRE
jgi:hypothetical protein